MRHPTTWTYLVFKADDVPTRHVLQKWTSKLVKSYFGVEALRLAKALEGRGISVKTVCTRCGAEVRGNECQLCDSLDTYI